jgi:hypothetical protein
VKRMVSNVGGMVTITSHKLVIFIRDQCVIQRFVFHYEYNHIDTAADSGVAGITAFVCKLSSFHSIGLSVYFCFPLKFNVEWHTRLAQEVLADAKVVARFKGFSSLFHMSLDVGDVVSIVQMSGAWWHGISNDGKVQ